MACGTQAMRSHEENQVRNVAIWLSSLAMLVSLQGCKVDDPVEEAKGRFRDGFVKSCSRGGDVSPKACKCQANQLLERFSVETMNHMRQTSKTGEPPPEFMEALNEAIAHCKGK